VESQPVEQPADASVTLKDKPPYALLSVLDVRSWLLVSVLFLLALRALETQLAMRCWTWFHEWRSEEFGFWLLENFQSRVAVFFYEYVAVSARYAFPVFINLLFFCIVFFVLHKRNPLGYLTLRNAGINAAITIAGVFVNNLRGTFIMFLQYGGNPMRQPDLILAEPRILGMGVHVSIILFWMMLSILVLALIYHFTIGGLPLRALLLSKTAIGAFAISVAFMAAQHIYYLYFFDMDLFLYQGDLTAFPVMLEISPTRLLLWLFKLHLLWAGLLIREPEPKPEESYSRIAMKQ